MTDDPRDTFARDQRAAEAEEATRDQQQWAMGLRTVRAQAANVEADTALTEAKASLYRSLAGLVAGVIVLLMLAAIVGAIHLVVT